MKVDGEVKEVIDIRSIRESYIDEIHKLISTCEPYVLPYITFRKI